MMIHQPNCKKKGDPQKQKKKRMYTTRPLSQLLKSPEFLAAAPDGPNSGFLVIQDEESVKYSCLGMCKRSSLNHLPFPQDKLLNLQYVSTSTSGVEVSNDPLFFIPVLNHPLSSNLYYAILPHRKRKGEALTSSRDEDRMSCCFCRCVKDVKSRPLDPTNIYQQFKIVPHDFGFGSKGYFVAKSVASDGYPPDYLRQKGWSVRTNTPKTFKLHAALGLDSGLRARLPELGSPEPRMVGRWYAPFIFVKEGALRDQVKKSMYYEVTLEQRWEQIFKTDRHLQKKGNSVVVDARVEKEEVFVGGGSKAAWNGRSAVDGVVWFKPVGGKGVGLRVELVERMKWEQKRGGWMGEREEREVKVHKVVKFQGGGGDWNEFGCYILVERFNLRRMDGSVLMSYDFKHFHHLKTKWE